MRTGVNLLLATVLLTQTGCGLFNKRKADAGGVGAAGTAVADAGGQKPFLGMPTPGDAAAAAAVNAATPHPTPAPAGIGGILAGQVLDRFHRRQPGSFIQVVDLSTPSANTAKIEVATDGQGYFTIQGLQTGKNYQLIARTKEGERILTGTTLAKPPNPRLSIYISDDFATKDTPPVPPPPGLPGKQAPASLDKPTPGATEEGSVAPPMQAPAAPAASPTAIPAPPFDPSRVTVEPGGFTRVPPVSLPSPPTQPSEASIVLPPPPMSPAVAPAPAAPPAAPAPDPMVPAVPFNPSTSSLPQAPAPVPYCVLVGRRLENFALNGSDGQPWEFRRNRTGKLLLIDFWFSSCGPCLQAIPHLVELQRKYKAYGLEVVGIAYERGRPVEQVQKVNAIRGRYSMNYTTLLGGGGPGPCPVRTQFEVNAFPTLILLDESGHVVWRSEGLDARQQWELDKEIERRLGVAAR